MHMEIIITSTSVCSYFKLIRFRMILAIYNILVKKFSWCELEKPVYSILPFFPSSLKETPSLHLSWVLFG